MTNDDTVFLHLMLMLIVDDPPHTSLQMLKKLLFTNAYVVPTNLSGSQYGHLALLMTPPEYVVLPHTIPFPEPLHPGPSHFTIKQS